MLHFDLRAAVPDARTCLMKAASVRVLFLLSALVLSLVSSAAEQRVALVIGNGAYEKAQRLSNPKNDAQDVAAALERVGFEIILGIDLDESGIEDATLRFARKARTADVALFYYSGHALQFGGVNYLIPVDAELKDEIDLRRMARVDQIVEDLQQARNLRILVLDACRDNPLAEQLKRSIGSTRAASLQRGLARIDAPQGMIVAFATQAGHTAADGDARNSPFTTAFLNHIETKAEIGRVFRRITADVYEETGREQLPELSLSFIGEYYLQGRPAPVAAPWADACSVWPQINATSSIAEVKAFLAECQSGTYSKLAKARLRELERQEAVVATLVQDTAAGQRFPARPASPTTGTGGEFEREAPQSPERRATGAGERLTLTTKLTTMTIDGQSRTMIGIKFERDSRELFPCFELEDVDGVLVSELVPGSPVRLAGLRPGDIIQAFDGEVVETGEDLLRLVPATPSGEEVQLDVFRPAAAAASDLIERLEDRADAQDMAAMACLGWAYDSGFGKVEKDPVEATRWYRKAAEAGDARSMAKLGARYAEGLGVTKDGPEAIHWFRKAAEMGDTDAMGSLGFMYVNGRGVTKDETKAVDWFRKAAEMGNANSMQELGLMYANGRGVSKDETKAVDWLRKAAESGHAVAMNNLAVMYISGRGVTKDEAEAVRWYRKAADLGQVQAMANLGFLYRNGQGVTKDEAEAVRWFRKSAEGGHVGAAVVLGRMYERGEGISKDEAEAWRWYRKAAKEGDAVAMIYLGFMTDEGRGVAKNGRRAARYVFDALRVRPPVDPVHKALATGYKGWSKEYRRELQRLLKEAGVYRGPIDGLFGPGTRQALEALAQAPTP